MKKSFKLNSNFLVRLKNFWFATQLLIVSVSLPVLCFAELSYSGNDVKQQQEEVIKNSVNQNDNATSLPNAGNTFKFG
jgi:hypothetical protein